MKVLILGHKGMLGHMVHKFFESKGIECITIADCRWPSTCFKQKLKNIILNAYSESCLYFPFTQSKKLISTAPAAPLE